MDNRKAKQFSKDDIIKAAMYGEVSVIDAQHIVNILDYVSISSIEQPEFCSNCIYSDTLRNCKLPQLHYCGNKIPHNKCRGRYKEEWG